MNQTTVIDAIISVLESLSIVPFAVSFQFKDRKYIKLLLAIGYLLVGAGTLCRVIDGYHNLYLSPVIFSLLTPAMYLIIDAKALNRNEDFKGWPLIFILVGMVPFAVTAIALPKQDSYSALLLAVAMIATFFAFRMKSDRYMRNMHIATALLSFFFYYTNSNQKLYYAFIAMLASIVVAKIRFERGEPKDR